MIGKGNRNAGKRREDDPDVKISKNLSWLLRHGAVEEKLNIGPDGYVRLDEVLAKDFYKQKKIDVSKIKQIVDSNDKKRFELKEEIVDSKPTLFIRAAQGHSINVHTCNEPELRMINIY